MLSYRVDAARCVHDLQGSGDFYPPLDKKNWNHKQKQHYTQQAIKTYSKKIYDAKEFTHPQTTSKPHKPIRYPSTDQRGQILVWTWAVSHLRWTFTFHSLHSLCTFSTHQLIINSESFWMSFKHPDEGPVLRSIPHCIHNGHTIAFWPPVLWPHLLNTAHWINQPPFCLAF